MKKPNCLYFPYLGISTGGDDFEPDISESVEDDHGVGPDADPVTGLGGRSTAGLTGASGAVELGLRGKLTSVIVSTPASCPLSIIRNHYPYPSISGLQMRPLKT